MTSNQLQLKILEQTDSKKLAEIVCRLQTEVQRLRKALTNLRSDLREPAEREQGLYRYF